jgi:hypothetical protein
MFVFKQKIPSWQTIGFESIEIESKRLPACSKSLCIWPRALPIAAFEIFILG